MKLKKMWVLACATAVLLPAICHGQILLYDGFSGDDYAAGPAIGTAYSGGTTNGYADGVWNSNDFADGGLSHHTLVTTPGVKVVRTNGDMIGALDTSAGGNFGAAGLVGTNNAIGGQGVSGTLYYSFLGREIDGNGNGWGGFNLWNDSPLDGNEEQFGVGNGGGPDDYVTYHHNNGEPPISDPPVVIDDQTHFFVVRADFVGDGKDTYTAWLDPDPALSEAAQAAGSFMANGSRDEDDNDGFKAFHMRGDNNSGQWEFDEVRFGLTWESVTPTVPEPATGILAILAVGMVALRRRK